MNKLSALILVVCLFIGQVSFSQSVIDPNDPVITYNPNNPPAQPAWGSVGKWVRTKVVSWNSDAFKSYIYKGMPFRIMFPKNYDATGATKYPMIIMWHGRGESATIYDNERNLKNGGQQHLNAVNNGKFEGFLVFPQNQSGFFSPSHFDFMHELITNQFVPYLNVDVNRIGTHGLSAGGSATWNVIIQYPQDYAVAVPMSAASTSFPSQFNIIREIPIWHSQGGLDQSPAPATSQQLVNAAAALGMDYTYTLYPNLGHGVWNTHYNEADFFPYFMRGNKANPVVYFGKKEFCPGDAIQATMAVTAGFSAYEWRKDGVVISGATTNKLTVTALGTYDVRIRRGTVWSEFSPIPVVLKMKAPTVTPPIEPALLASNVIPAPDGSTSVDLTVNGNFNGYAWKLSGSSTVLGTSKVFTATAPGEYVVSVTEPFGCASSNSPVYKVVNAAGSNGPAAAVNPAAFAMSKTSIKVVWSDVPNTAFNETGYEIYRSETAGSNYKFITLTGADSVRYIDEGLIANTQYYYIIRAVNQNAASAVSAEVSATTFADVTPPSAPLNLQVVNTTGNSVNLIWNASTDDAGVEKYEVYKGTYRVVVTEDTFATVNGLTENSVYNFTVKARDYAGNKSAASNQVTAAAAYSGLTYSYYTGTWSNLPDFNTLTPVATGQTPNVDITLRTQNSNYAFKWDGYIQIPVAGNYTFETNSDDGSKLYIGGYGPSFQVVNNDGTHGTRYREGTYNFPAPGAYPITITYFQGGSGQSMNVYWKNTAHGVGSRQNIPNSAFGSGFVMPCCTPAKPTNVAANGISYNKVNITWSDNSNNELGFQIYRSTQNSIGYSPIGIVGPNITTYDDSMGLTPNTTYYYQIVALGQYGQSHSGYGEVENLGNIKYGVGATDNRTGTGYIMYSVQNLFSRFTSSQPNSNNSEHVIAVVYSNGSWRYDNNSTLVAFTPVPSDLLIATVDFSTDQIASLQGTQGVVNGMQSGYGAGDLTFFANRWNGNNDNGEFTVNGTYFTRNIEIFDDATTLPLPSIPIVPTGLIATATSTSSVQLKWADNSNNETHFVVYRSLNNNASYLPHATVPANATDTVIFNDTIALFPNTTYYYYVEVVNAGGSNISSEINVTTLNTKPQLTSVADLMMRHSTVENLQLFATDPDNDALTFTPSNLPSFATFTDYGDGSALIQFTPSVSDTNVYNNLVISVSDVHGGVCSDTFNLTVTDNYIPTLDSIQNFVLNEGDSAMVTVVAHDANGVSTLTWDDSELPSFATLTVNSANGTAVLKLKPMYADGGSYPGMNVVVTDDQNASANRRFNITVNEVNPNQTVKVNYRQNLNAPAPWNNIVSVASTNLNNTNGAASGISTQLMTTAWNAFNQGAQTGNNSGIVPDAVLKEYYYFGIFSAPNTVDLRLSGLSTQKFYNISFVASSIWTGTPNNGTTVFTSGSQSASVYAHGNTANAANLTGLQANASGQITVTMSKAAGTNVGYLNGFVLEEIYNYGAAPDAPRNLAAAFNSGQVNLSWYDAPYNETGYDVFRSDSVNGTYVKINAQPLAANSTSFSDPNVIQNNFYHYKVKAVNTFGESVFSNSAYAYITNTPPVITVSGDTVLSVDSTGKVVIKTIDLPNNLVSLSVSGLPPFATFIDSANGNGSILAYPSAFDLGEYTIAVTATDELNATSVKTFKLSVTEALLYSVYVNFNQYANAAGAAPWNNTNKAPAINDTWNNLKDHNNVNTTIDMQLMTGFGGAFNQGAQTGNNSGVVPDAVLKEYYHFGIFGAPNTVQIKVKDLDNTKRYNFKFMGSSVFSGSGVTDNGNTNYTIGNQTASLYVQNNTGNFAVISNVVANSNGEVLITITKGAGASVGYINAMIIEVLPGNSAAFDPTNLTAEALSGSEIKLNWNDNSFDETGYEIQRSLTGNDVDFTTIATTAANAQTYTDAGRSKNTVYYYRVRGVKSIGYTAYTNVAYTGTVAYRVYININGSAAYDQAAPWNNLTIPSSNGQVYSGFRNDDGIYTGMQMTWVTGMQGSNDWGATTNNNSGVVPDKVMKSFFFNDAFDPAGEITMSGMSQEYSYNFKFFGSIVTGYVINTNFTVDGRTVTNSQTNNTSQMVSINGVNCDENNEIDIRVQEAAGSKWAIFNGMIIEAVTAPEPPYSRKGNEEEKDKGIAVRYGESDPAISLYPNPIQDGYVTMDFSNVSYGKINLMITDITGRIVKTQEFNNDQLNGSLRIDLNNGNLNNGMYILRVEFADGQVRTERLIKF